MNLNQTQPLTDIELAAVCGGWGPTRPLQSGYRRTIRPLNKDLLEAIEKTVAVEQVFRSS